MTDVRPLINLVDARARHPGQAFPSPCVSVCQMNEATQWCEGCYRTIDEIAGWSALAPTEREAIWQRIEQRQGSGPW